MNEKRIDQWMKSFGIDASWYDIKSDNLVISPIADTGSSYLTTSQLNELINQKITPIVTREKTEQEKAYENYLSRKNKYSKYDLKISKDAVILYNKNKKVKHVSVAKDEEFDREKGLMMCLLKDMGVTYSDIQIMLRNYDKEQAKLMKERIAKEEEKAKRRAEQEANTAKKAALNQ